MDVWYWYQMKMRTFVYLWKISIIYLHSLRFHSVINQIVLNKNFNKTSSSLNKGRHCGIKSLYRYTYRHIVMFNPLNERLIYFTSSFAIVSWLFSYFANMHICWMFEWVHQSPFYPAKQFQADTIGLMWQFNLR